MPAQAYDSRLADLLHQTETDSTAFSEVVIRFADQVVSATNYLLCPGQPSPTPEQLAERYCAEHAGSIVEGWLRIIHDGDIAVERILGDLLQIPRDRSLRNRGLRSTRALQVVATLRYLLLARCYSVRAATNQDIASVSPNSAHVIRSFHRFHLEYDKRLREVGHSQPMLKHSKLAGDIAALSDWRAQFGRIRDNELGWGRYARTADEYFLYQRRRLESIQRWRSVLHGNHEQLFLILVTAPAIPFRVLAAIFSTLFGVTTGYGIKPERLVATVALAILGFAGLYVVDDYWISHCGGDLSKADYGRYLSYAVTNFTNLGPSGACGPHAGFLAPAESLLGYFLLSVLVGLIVTRLLER